MKSPSITGMAPSAGGASVKITDLSEARLAFYNNADPEFRRLCALETRKLGSRQAFANAAAMLIETARHPSLSRTEKMELVDDGHETYEAATRKDRKRTLSGPAAGAALRLAMTRSTEWLVVDNQLPPRGVTAGDYRQVADVANRIADITEATFPLPCEDDHIGALSEASVWLLLARFGKNEVPGEYVPYFSFFTEDHGNGKAEAGANRWDVSVFTQSSIQCPPELSHKVQVKTSLQNHIASEKTYADDITVVHTLEDLRIDHHGLRLATVIRECATELDQRHATRVSERLDSRTDNLLDLMG